MLIPGLWKKPMDPPPESSEIACSNDANECNISWLAYHMSFTNWLTKHILVNK